jgi:hypothetical protein
LILVLGSGSVGLTDPNGRRLRPAADVSGGTEDRRARERHPGTTGLPFSETVGT